MISLSTPDPIRQTPIPASLLALAPGHLPNFRKNRYVGDDLCVSLDRLAGHDQTVLKRLYRDFTELLYAIANASTDDAQKWREVELWTQRHELDPLIDEVRELGAASQAQGASEELAKAMHDVRGGALSALLGRLQLLEVLPHDEDQLKTIFVLARDHLKIMRSAVVGLDEPRRNADRHPKSHDMQLMLEKWHGSVVGPNRKERPVRLRMDCRYRGALTECCLESAAVDRIFYNLASNACRHCAGDRLDMVVFPVPESGGECLRFVLSNEVAEKDAAYLRALGQPGGGSDQDSAGHPVNLRALFEPKVSSTGSGYGLTVVAEFVAGAFGLPGRAAAVAGLYVGATLDRLTFRIWFHWPIASDKLPAKSDDYHHPAQSLSEA